LKKKYLAVTALLIALPLSGCGDNVDDKADDAATGTTVTTTSTAATASTAAGGGAPADGAVDLGMKDFSFVPATVTAKAGSVKFTVHNDGQATHNYKIRQAGKIVAATKDLGPAGREEITANLTAGTYTAICDKPGHESLGMSHTITVQ